MAMFNRKLMRYPYYNKYLSLLVLTHYTDFTETLDRDVGDQTSQREKVLIKEINRLLVINK